MATVLITVEAHEQFAALSPVIQGRVLAIYARLARWPEVSGAKRLKGDFAGNYRVRTGDFRVVFRVADDEVTVWKIGNRRDVYLD